MITRKTRRIMEEQSRTDEQLDPISEILAASEKRINNHRDWYAILQLNSDDRCHIEHQIQVQYEKLSSLVNPEKNESPRAQDAFNLIGQAWSVLSDPLKRNLYDKEISMAMNHDSTIYTEETHQKRWKSRANKKSKTISTNHKRKDSDSTSNDKGNFWTVCPYCCNIYEYISLYRNCNLRCQNCKRGFRACEISAPPIVPGKEAYYCSWGFFPLVFSGQHATEDREGGHFP